ncbi:hypothetical protein Pan258_43610 [Symmachiella dynata]|uniref:YHYH protein n=1 Tax=Symmachiella dynata TaxID=2527995 RepID=UPI00118B05CB|nr:YHYH protein [Symmachiella dynata]QDT50304.1 hypothetical protein Pan258_43610 [Symmachiella dynata]
MKPLRKLIAATITFLSLATVAWTQFPGGPPRMRRHTTTQSTGKLRLVPDTKKSAGRNQVSIKVDGDVRVIRANGIPNHSTGAFPNRGNPHRITAQKYLFRIPAEPEQARRITPLGLQDFGIAVNGIPFDPGAAEFFLGNRQSGWQYEALSGAVRLGIDGNYAHVQPTGAYHYHGLPTELLEILGLKKESHSPLVGWAADGYPIYAVYGYADAENPESKVKALASSYRLKSGRRPSGRGEPGGKYDGTFVADYEFVEGAGDLDECNGRFSITPDFPAGTYAYFLTKEWPVIPRAFSGTPSRDFERSGPPGARGRRPPPRRRH